MSSQEESVPVQRPQVTFDKTASSGPTVAVELQDLEDADHQDELVGTQGDKLDMDRMGKQQLFRREFKLFPSFAFVILVQLTWVCLLA